MTIVAWDWVASIMGTWSAALVAGIIKWLVLRIGGSKLYEEKAVPFVGGFHTRSCFKCISGRYRSICGISTNMSPPFFPF